MSHRIQIDMPDGGEMGAYLALPDSGEAGAAVGVAAAADSRAGWECHIHDDGGHAFDNWDAPRFSRPEPANRAWAQTTDFLARTLPSYSSGSE